MNPIITPRALPRTPRRLLLTGLGLAACGWASGAWAQAAPFPSAPIRIQVGYSAGGAVDVVARAVGQRLQADLGQAVIIENKPGAASNIAAKATIAAAADGHTLMMAANAVTANMTLFQPPPYDLEKDLAPVALIGRVPVVVAVNPASPYASLAELLAAARAKPEAVAYATPGNGSTPHLAMELFAVAAKAQMLHVPYKGGTQALTDVIGGQVPVVAVNVLEALPHIRSGRLRAVAVLSARRSGLLPEVPTLAESGFAGFEASVWYGLLAPAATPAPVLARLSAAALKAAQSPEVRERLNAAGGEATPMDAPAFAQHLRAERERYARLITAHKIKPD
ncbi:tripartite tricarboxylate transporter substrate-binding protein [Aquabacterium sp. OR-4]|uniref:tripartite tricarboxylate transporter substrate-binding protein n=1 Tax=Aquabacterium sp. OR-4 TaxID=2978127 RepID=UPI0028C66227|nr:tripartite tricarboxylate transporter substrate-binding protein [Aquabacterium sp. OR-4]MDT7834635.1 tripartite tricarboxylate transporter substrate-binding protein [Aquabacterium sp. OR-4]